MTTYVGVGRRAVAILIDSVLLVAAVAIVLKISGAGAVGVEHARYGTSESWHLNLTGVPGGLAALVWLAYMSVFESRYGASLGKFALGVRVVRVDGTPMDFFTSVVRNVLRAVDGLFFYLVGAIIMWRSPLRQRVGDIAARTVVVPNQLAVDGRIDPSLRITPAASDEIGR
ncbi:MAG: RDD family protein [Actinomycetota bacterium]